MGALVQADLASDVVVREWASCWMGCVYLAPSRDKREGRGMLKSMGKAVVVVGDLNLRYRLSETSKRALTSSRLPPPQVMTFFNFSLARLLFRFPFPTSKWLLDQAWVCARGRVASSGSSLTVPSPLPRTTPRSLPPKTVPFPMSSARSFGLPTPLVRTRLRRLPSFS
jgi:hypothetical protein